MSHDFPFFTDLLIIIGCSLPVLFLFRHFGLPPIAGYGLTGMVIGPYGLGLIRNIESVETAAEVGVVLLLFMVGLEMSLSGLVRISRRIYLMAIAQIVVTSLIGFGGAQLLGLNTVASLVIGFVIAVSSSAIVLKGLVDHGELNTPLGRMVVTICVVQDFAFVPMMLIVGFLSVKMTHLMDVVFQTLSVILLVGFLYVFGRYILPFLLRKMVASLTQEFILLFTMLVLLGTAWLTSLTGLSLALGAFAAGLILSETDYYAQIFAEVSPFQSLFSSLFFVSIGMLLDVSFVIRHAVPVILVSVGVLLVKMLVVVAVGIIAKATLRERVQGGFYIAQIGEFSFLLLGAAVAGGILHQTEFQYLIAATALTLSITPVIMHWAPRVAWQAQSHLGTVVTGAGAPEAETTRSRPKPAVLVIGYGLNGQNVSRVLRESAIYHEILDENPEMVRRAREEGELIHYGDATRIEVLRHLRFEEFDTAVLAISDAAATRRAVSIMRNLNPDVHMIVRTRYVKEVDDLSKMGANVVVPEEFETSLRIFSELLIHYHIPPHIIAAQIELVRRQSYGMLRSAISLNVSANLHTFLMQRLVEAVPISAESPVIGRTLAELELMHGERCMAISVIRNNSPIEGGLDNLLLRENDMVVLYGDHAALNEALKKFH